MEKYHKIQSVYKRYTNGPDKGKFNGIVTTEEFKYLWNNQWDFSEKVLGTNVRILWTPDAFLRFGGRTENSQMPTFLYDKLNELFTVDKMIDAFPRTPVCLYGEGYGAKTQKGGGNYISDGVDFALFDVKIDGWWLKREAVEDIATQLDITCVPIIGRGTIDQATEMTKAGITSTWGPFPAGGLVLRPVVEMFDRGGRRIITKMKTADWKG